MERIEKLKTFLDANPGDSFLKHALALEMVKLGNEEEAQKLFEDILTADPSYVGSYYHLAKLLERRRLPDLAAEWYQRGLSAAQKAGDMHALNELRAAYEDLLDEI